MEFLFLILILIVCFFILYILCRQDFVLLRQNISMAQIMDAAIIAIIFAFITARLFFLINNLDFSLLHAIRFFYFIKFAGVSPLGFAIGGLFAIAFLMRGKKGIFRIFDIFSISFLPLYSFSQVFKNYPQEFAIVAPIVTIVLLVILFIFFLKSHYRYILRDGSISLILLLIISTVTLFYEYLNQEKHNILFDLSAIQVLSIILAASSVVFLFLNQRKLKI